MSSSSRTPVRPALGLALGLVTAGVLIAPAATAAPLAAETGTPTPSPVTTSGGATSGTAKASAYRFWGFYQQKDGKWSFAQSGPYQVAPAEGAVEGWRFAVAEMESPRLPRASASFEDICGKTAGETGKKRVGVIVDYGRKADAPEGGEPPKPIAKCALVPSAASSAQVLDAVSESRADKGMVCGIDGYPKGTGCSEPVATVSEEAKAADDKIDISVTAAREQPKPQDAAELNKATPQGPDKKVLTGVAVAVVALAGGAAFWWRRRTQA